MPAMMSRPTEQEEMLRCTQLKLLLTARTFVNESNWDFLLGCPFWRIYVNDRPGAFVLVGEKRWELRPDRVYCIPAWLEFRTGARGAVRHDFVHFEWSGLAPNRLRHGVPEPVELRLEGPLVDLCRRWQEGLATGRESTLAQHVWTQAWIYAVVAALLTQRGEAIQRQILNRLEGTGRLRPALERLESNLTQPPGNAELARLCSMSADHFIKRFREEVGLTPARYGLEHRITQAAQWLANTDRKLEDIAESTGFADRFHFSRAFRVRLRESPAAYRRKFRAVRPGQA